MVSRTHSGQDTGTGRRWGKKRGKRRTATVTILAAVAAALAVAAAVVVTAGEGATPEQVIGLLGSEPTPGDSIDPAIIGETPACDPASARHLTGDGDATYWVATNDVGFICIIAHYVAGNGEWALAMTGAPPGQVAASGVTLSLLAYGEGVDVTLLGDGFMTESAGRAVAAAGGSVPMENLVVFPYHGRPSRLVVESGTGGEIDLGAEAVGSR